MTEIISAALAGLASGYLVGRLTGNAIKKRIATSTPRLYRDLPIPPKKKIRKKHKRRAWTQTELDSLKSLVRKGYGQSEISKLLGRPQSSINKRIRKHQLV